MDINIKTKIIKNGFKLNLYEPYPELNIQLSKNAEYVAVPHWYYNIEYLEEQRRGYDFHEDLYVPGYFEVEFSNNESIIFSASLSSENPEDFENDFSAEKKIRPLLNNYASCLKNAASQFITHIDNKTYVIAGYPWFGVWGRDTFIALPGLTLSLDDTKTFKSVIDTMLGESRGGLFSNVGVGENASFNSIDAPFWFFWALQQYTNETKKHKQVWKEYSPAIKSILNALRIGTDYNIGIHSNGLIYGGQEGSALTWMDALVNGKHAVTPRIGYCVEINALWYNAICFLLLLAEKSGDEDFILQWQALPERIQNSFKYTFTDTHHNYLADYTDIYGNKNWDVRPNMVMATSIEYSPIDDELKKGVLDTIEKELLTPKGLRTLSPKNPAYQGRYFGTQEERDKAYHQGTVWPWLISHFAEGYIRLYKKSGLRMLETMVEQFEEEMFNHGIGSISEVYNGNPPHTPAGTIAQAWSVSEILRIKKMIETYKK